jgi:hypothetical protein
MIDILKEMKMHLTNIKPRVGDIWRLTQGKNYADLYLISLNEEYKNENKAVFFAKVVYATTEMWKINHIYEHTQPGYSDERSVWTFIRTNRNIYDELEVLLEE